MGNFCQGNEVKRWQWFQFYHRNSSPIDTVDTNQEVKHSSKGFALIRDRQEPVEEFLAPSCFHTLFT